MQGMKHMLGYEVRVEDKKIGEVEDFLMNEDTWTVHYIAVRTGGELSDARALARIGWVRSVDLERRSIEVVSKLDGAQNGDAAPSHGGASSLRSVREIADYRVNSLEGPCGTCVDLLADTTTWALPYLVVNTKQRVPNRHVLVPTAWVRRISWQERQTDVAVHRLMIQQAQRFDPASHDAAFGAGRTLAV